MTQIDLSIAGTIHEIAGYAGDRVAIVQHGRTLTYATLDEVSGRLAGFFRSKGVANGTVVGLQMEHSIEYVVAVLAVMKAGGVFFPILPATPRERLDAMLETARPGLIITSKPDAGHIDGAYVFSLDEADPGPGASIIHWPEYAPVQPEPTTGKDDPAYIFFTSGSTGRPKAVLGRHAGLLHFIRWQSQAYGIDGQVRAGALTPITFDPSLRDIFLPLYNGGVLLIPDQTIPDFGERLSWIIEQKINLIHVVPSVYEKIHDAIIASGHGIVSDLRHIFFAGEPLYTRPVGSWKQNLPASVTLVNLYGPTETTLAKCHYRLPDDLDTLATDIIPLGKPIPGTDLHIVDPDNRPLPQGQTGEIVIQTAFCSLGYLDQADNEGKFILQEAGSAPWYKTGDLGRIDAHGDLHYHGRTDHQVKINGVRIELPEIEAVLLKKEEIRKCCVVYRKASASLLAFFVADEEIAAQELRAFMRDYLPVSMIPARFIRLEDFPYNQNGKVDRLKLAALELPAAEQTDVADSNPAYSETEQLIHNAWSEVLKIDRIAPDDNFFEIGGHSLNGLVIISKLSRQFGIRFGINGFFDNPTIRSFAGVVEAYAQDAAMTTAAPEGEDIPAAPLAERYPASLAQQRMFLLNEITGNSAVYNIYGAYAITGGVDTAALTGAVRDLLQRHESLRTGFSRDEQGKVWQHIRTMDELSFELQVHAVSAAGHSHDLLKKAFSCSFDLERDLLLHAGVIRQPDDTCVLYYCMHHIISDGWSLEVFIRELLALYESRIKGARAALPALKIQYKDYAVWESRKGNDPAAEKYWLDRLGGELPVLHFPTSYPRPAIQTYNGDSFSVVLPADTAKNLRAIGNRHNTSYFCALLTVVYTLLHRYSGQGDIVLGAPVANRDHADLQHQIGLYVNTLAYRLRIGKDDSFLSLMEAVRDMVNSGNQHRLYPFDLLTEKLDIKRDPGRNPLFSVMVNYLTENTARPGQPSAFTAAPIAFPQLRSKFDFSFYFYDRKDQTGLTLIYNTDLFSRSFMQEVLQHFLNLAQSLAQQPALPVSRAAFLSDAEKHRLLETFNDTAAPRPGTERSGLVSLFRRCVRDHGPETALTVKGVSYSYSFLDSESNRLGRYLQECYAVRPGCRVVVSTDRDQWLPVALLAVLKLGGTYISVEPDQQAFILERIIAENDVPCVIDVQLIRTFSRQSDRYADDALNLEAPGNPVTAIIYTTGSTGKPKGVMITRSNILNRIEWMQSAFPFRTGEVCALKTSISFVDHIWELFGPLLNGVPLACFRKEELLDIPYFIEQLGAAKVSRIVLVPSLLNGMLAFPDLCKAHLSGLIYWTSSGETLSPNLIRQFYAIFDPKVHKLLNIYGATEVTADATCYDTSEGYGARTSPLRLFNTSIDKEVRALIDAYDHSEEIIAPGAVDTIMAGFEAQAPDGTPDEAAYLAYLEHTLLPRVVNISARKYIGHMTGPLPEFSVSLAQLATRLNQNLVKVETSLAATMIEVAVIKRVHKAIFGQADGFYRQHSHRQDGTLGIFTNGGTLSNITALYYALCNALPADGAYKGYVQSGLVAGLLHYGYKGIAVIGSRWCHYSIEKALKLFGLGKDAFAELATDEQDVPKLRELLGRQIAELRGSGILVLSVIGVAGTTESGRVEPLRLLGEAARAHQVHFHVDAAFGGAYIFSDRYRNLLDGIHLADSVTICAHKQLYVPVGSSLCLFADSGIVIHAENRTNYQARAGSYDLGKFTIEGTRNFNSLILHGLLSVFGEKGLGAAVDHHHQLSRTFADLVESHPAFELFAAPHLNLVLYRYRPYSLRGKTALNQEALRLMNEVNEAIQRKQFERGNSFVSFTKVRDDSRDTAQHVVFRTIFSNPYTTADDLKAVLLEQLEIARELDASLPEGPAADQGFEHLGLVRTGEDNARIGRPISNVKIYLLDEQLQLVPIGAEGIIYVGGDNITNGYLGDPELTKDKFIDSPFYPGEVLFRTDDIGRWTPEGALVYIGRKDHQHKIRGNRISLLYIEDTILQSGMAAQAAVTCEAEQLTAYIVADAVPELASLYAFLKEKLPAYMIPEMFVLLDELPRTSSGKLSRQALKPENGRVLSSAMGNALPADLLEKEIYDLWKDHLALPVRWADEDFFALGGHSLMLVRLLQRYHESFGVRPSIQELFLHTTIRAHAQLIRSTGKAAFVPIRMAAPSDTYPVSAGQRRLWGLSQAADASLAYHMTGAFTIRQPLDTGCFLEAFAAIVQKHESLRTNFILAGEELRQVIRSGAGTVPELIDAAGMTDEDIRRHALRLASVPFDLSSDPLIRAWLFRRADDHFVLCYCMHHIVSDLRSMKVLAADLMDYYAHLCGTRMASVPELKIQQKDYAVWAQSEQETTRAHSRAFFREHLKDMQLLTLPADKNRPPVKTYNGSTVFFDLPAALYLLLKQEAGARHSTMFAVLLAAIKGLFYRYTQQEDILLGIVSEGRDHPDLKDQIGFFVHTFPVRTVFDPEDGFGKLCALVQQNVVSCFAHQQYALDELMNDLQIRRDPSRAPLLDVVVSYENYEHEDHPAAVAAFQLTKPTAQFDLTFGFREGKSGIGAKIEYNTDLYEQETIARMAAHLQHFLDAALRNDSAPLYTLDYLTPEEKEVAFI